MSTLLLILVLAANSAHAASCPTDAAKRLASIETCLTQAARASHTWALTWAGVWTVATVAQGTLALTTHEHDSRVDLTVGAAAAAAGLVPTLLFPPTVIDAHARLLAMKEQHTDVCTQLAAAEQLVVESAADERLSRSWLAHTGNVLFNVGVGMVLGVGFRHWSAATLSMAAGIPLGELMIFTQPFQSAKLLQLTLVPSDGAYELRLALAL